MAYKTIRTSIRTDSNTPFFEDSANLTEVTNYINTNFRDTGKLVSKNIVLDADQTMCHTTVIWSSKQAWEDFFSDAYLTENFFIASKQYESENAIFSVFSGEDVPN